MRLQREDVVAVAFLIVVTLAYFWPMLRRGPARQFVVDGDFSRQFFPFRAFEASEWWSGRIPLWNPDIFAGHPFQADIQTGVFYPIALINAVIFGRQGFPFIALEGEIVVHTFLAAVFMYLLARKVTKSRWGALVAGIAFGLGGYITSYPAQQLAVLETAAWLPLIVLCLEHAVETTVDWRWLAAASVFFGVAVLAGHPQTDLFFAYATEGYLLCRLIWARVSWPTAARALVGYPVLAAALAAIQLIPTIAFLYQSSRAEMGYPEAAHGYLLAALWEVLVPLWHGEKALSIGVAALFLAALGAIRARREPLAFWLVVGLVALPLSTGGETPLFWLLYRVAPGWNLFRDQERVIVMFSFSAALLAARGVAEIEDQIANSRLVRVWPIVTGVAAISALIAFLVGPTLGAVNDLRTNLGLDALALTGLSGLLLIANRRRLFGRLVGFLLITFVVGEAFAINFGNNLGPTLPDPRPRLAATATFMRRLPEPFRIRGIDENVFPSNYGTLLGTPTIGGDTPFTLQRMNEMLKSDADWRVWQILNVKFFISTGDALAGLNLVYQDGPLKTYQMGDSLPRAWAVTNTEVAGSPAEAKSMILAPGYHPGNIVALERTPSFGNLTGGNRPDVHIVNLDPQRVAIDATATSNAMLILSNQYYPDWQVTRDGEPVELFRANYLTMAAELPAGAHHFEFIYRPRPFYVGTAVSALALFALGMIVYPWSFCRRRPPAATNGGRVPRAVWTTLALAVVLVSFALRVHDLALPNLTGDEWFMLRNHDEGPGWILHQARTFEPHPLVYYLGLAGWIELAGRGEFAMRFPSVASGVVLTAASVGLGRLLIGDRAGLLAGAVVALNPYQIMESQNARNYAMVTAATAVGSLLFVRALRRGRRLDWCAYGIAMFVAVNVHYDAVLVLAVHVVFVVVARVAYPSLRKGSVLPSRDGPGSGVPRWWLPTTAIVVGSFGLWLAYAWPALAAYHGYFPTPVGLDRVLGRSLATFSLGTLASVRESIPVIALAAIGSVWLALTRPTGALFLGLYVLLPIVAVSALFLARPMFDERYLIVLAPGFLVLVAAAIEAGWSMTWPLGAAVAAGVAILTAPMIPRTLANELTDRADYRSMATWVATFGTTTDPVVATGHGQAELFGYYAGPKRPVLILDDATILAARLPSIIDGHVGLWLLPYGSSPTDAAATAILGDDAVPVANRWFSGAQALYFGSLGQLRPSDSPSATWKDTLTITGVDRSPTEMSPGGPVSLAFHLRNTSDSTTPKVSIRLIDSSGHLVAQSDSPVSTAPRLTAGDRVIRGGVLLPPTSPPGPYSIALLLYDPNDGQAWPVKSDGSVRDGALVVGTINVGVRPDSVPVTEAGVEPGTLINLENGLTLIGRDPLPSAVDVGGTLDVRLVWRSDRPSLPNLTRTIELLGGDEQTVGVLTAPILPPFPTSRWSSGQMLDDRVSLAVPATASSGRAVIRLRVGDLGPAYNLGSVTIVGPSRSFSRLNPGHPVAARFGSFATLLGFDLASDIVAPGSLAKLTLDWSAIGPADRRYFVFVHLVDAHGRISGQVDRAPLDGRRSTDGWVAGEYLHDVYDVTLNQNAIAGVHQIEVGLYDPSTGARVPVTLADGSTGDHVTLGSIKTR